MLHFHEILPAESTGLAVAGMGLARERIPLFDEEKQLKTLIPALRRQNVTLQVIDSIRVRGEFRYAASSGIFSADQGNYLAEQWNYSGICLPAGFRAEMVFRESQDLCCRLHGLYGGMLGDGDPPSLDQTSLTSIEPLYFRSGASYPIFQLP